MIDVLIAIVLAKSFVQGLYNLYLLQFNEYRYDRFSSYVKRRYGMWIVALPFLTLIAPVSKVKLPKPTSKAMLITGISLLLHIGLFLAPDIFRLELSVLVLLTSPFIQQLCTYMALPIEWPMRQQAYSQARNHIQSLKGDKLKVVGITGSYGKSTTKYFLNHMLSSTFKVATTAGSINTPLGLSRAINRDLNNSHDFFIAEMGAYKRGEIEELASIAQPDIAILTGIGNQHIELFGSQENIVLGKSELLASLKENSLAFVNANTENKPVLPKQALNIQEYSLKDVSSEYKKALEKTDIPPFLYINIVPAILLAEKLGVKKSAITKALSTLPLPPKTMNISTGYKGSTVIDDSFSSNVKGTEAAIDTLLANKKKKKLMVMSCLIELGPKAKAVHRNIGKTLSENNVRTLVTTTECFADISSTFSGDQAGMCVNKTTPEKANEWLFDKIDKDTVVLVEGKVNPSIVNFIKSKS